MFKICYGLLTSTLLLKLLLKWIVRSSDGQQFSLDYGQTYITALSLGYWAYRVRPQPAELGPKIGCVSVCGGLTARTGEGANHLLWKSEPSICMLGYLSLARPTCQGWKGNVSSQQSHIKHAWCVLLFNWSWNINRAGIHWLTFDWRERGDEKWKRKRHMKAGLIVIWPVCHWLVVVSADMSVDCTLC